MTNTKAWTDRDWTVADAYAYLPEGGTKHYEVIDGELFVSPEASEHHHFRSFELATLLTAGCPPHLPVSGGAINLDIGNRRHLEPDLAVERVEDFGLAESQPVPVIEILSPSNWRHDYQEVAKVGPGDAVDVTRPFPVRLAPGEWTRLP